MPLPAPGVAPSVTNPSGAVRGRMYLFHGLGYSPSTFVAADPYDDLVTGLAADGWQVVSIAELYDSVTTQATQSEAHFDGDATKGASFRTAVRDHFIATRDYVDTTYGAPAGGTEALCGVSWGGLMVQLIAESAVDDFRAYMMHLPATCPPYMTEFTGDDLTSLHSLATLPANGPVWISYGGADNRVGGRPGTDTAGTPNTSTLAAAWAALNPRVTIRGLPGDTYYVSLDHTTNATVVGHMLAWAAGIGDAEGYGNTVSAGYDDGAVTVYEPPPASILVDPASPAWNQIDTQIVVRVTADAPSTVEATITGTAGGLLRFRGADADRFDASLDGTTWASSVDIPAGTSTVHLRVTPEAPGTTLSAEIGVPV